MGKSESFILGGGASGKMSDQGELVGGIFLLLVPTGATHLALESRGSRPGREDLCRGQVSNSLGVAVSVFAVGGS